MFDMLKTLLKQPYAVILLIIGAFFLAFPFITIGKDPLWSTHPPTSKTPLAVGCFVILVSLAVHCYGLFAKREADAEGLDLSRVKETRDDVSISIGDCEIRIVEGHIEEQMHSKDVVVVLPCNEYFDDRCAFDNRSALGAYASRTFGDQVDQFVALARRAATEKFGEGNNQQKTETEFARSFGTGKCVLLERPLGRTDPVALISTTTQRAGEGLRAQISCLFDGMHELNKCLADARINEAIMPVLGGGHGGIKPSLAFIGLVLAVAEASRYGHGAQRLKRVTIVVFRKDAGNSAEVGRTVIRRALALISAQSNA